MSLKDCVCIQAFDLAGGMVVNQTFDTCSWYENLHDIIDKNEERSRLRIVKISGQQYDVDGVLFLDWQASYNATGMVTELIERRSDGTQDIRTWKADGSIDTLSIFHDTSLNERLKWHDDVPIFL